MNYLEDERLSWKAKGLLAYLLSRPKDYRPNLQKLARASTDGRTALITALDELQATGYLLRWQERGEKGKGFGECRYEAHATARSSHA